MLLANVFLRDCVLLDDLLLFLLSVHEVCLPDLDFSAANIKVLSIIFQIV